MCEGRGERGRGEGRCSNGGTGQAMKPEEKVPRGRTDISGLCKDSSQTSKGSSIGWGWECCWARLLSSVGSIMIWGIQVMTIADSAHSHWGSRQMLVWAI